MEMGHIASDRVPTAERGLGLAIFLWIVFLLLLKFPNPIGMLEEHPLWMEFVLTSRWVPDDLRQKAFVRLNVSPSANDAPLLLKLAKSEGSQFRPNWVGLLRRIPDPRVEDFFMDRVRGTDKEDRKEGIMYLSQHGTSRALPLLREAILDSNRDISSRGIAGIGRLGDRNGLPLLMAILAKKTAPDALTEYELFVGKTASKLAGLPLLFSPKCLPEPEGLGESLAFLRQKLEIEKFPERTMEIQNKWDSERLDRMRKRCDNHRVVEDRSVLLKWWGEAKN